MEKEKLRERYRIRVQNCVSTIMDVHKTLCERYGNKDLVAGFDKLEAEVSRLDMAQVSEGDILLVEQATNALLAELRKIFDAGGLGPVYKSLKN
jgi:chromosome condensin MukBEF complex kleisin-like MukF subunit